MGLYANATMIAADVSFSASSTYLGFFKMHGSTTSGFDDNYAGPPNPLFVDININGIEDTWETSHGLSLGADNRNTSPTWNGVTVVQAYVAGTDSTDYFNSVAPTLPTLGGNNQIGLVNQFNVQPLELAAWNGAGTTPLVNAPVTFTVQGGGMLLASTSVANPSLYNLITLYSDAEGTVQAYFKKPAVGNVISQINVSAGVGHVSLLTRSIAIGTTDSDHNGLSDAWEAQYFGHLGVDQNADPDADGLSNRQFSISPNTAKQHDVTNRTLLKVTKPQ